MKQLSDCSLYLHSVFFQRVFLQIFPMCTFTKCIFPKCIFQSVFFQSAFFQCVCFRTIFQSVFLQNEIFQHVFFQIKRCFVTEICEDFDDEKSKPQSRSPLGGFSSRANPTIPPRHSVDHWYPPPHHHLYPNTEPWIWKLDNGKMTRLQASKWVSGTRVKCRASPKSTSLVQRRERNLKLKFGPDYDLDVAKFGKK